MHRFVGSRSSKLEWIFNMLVCAVMGGALFTALHNAWKHGPQPILYGLALACILLIGGLSAWSVHNLLDTFTVYEADETDLTQRDVFGTRHMRWRDIVRLHERLDMHDSQVALVDS